MTDFLTRDEAIRRIRAGLKRRTGKSWSVTGGRGTGWGWIRISAPPARRVGEWGGVMTDADRAELGQALGYDRPVHMQGESIPASSDYYRAAVERAETGTTSVNPQPYWD